MNFLDHVSDQRNQLNTLLFRRKKASWTYKSRYATKFTIVFLLVIHQTGLVSW